MFKQKLDELIDDIVEKQIFGKVKALVWVVEFQKRGLPHSHILIILEDEFKLDSIEKIDKIVWAEIPDKELFPTLHERVINHMIHVPCNTKFRKCKKSNGYQCNKRFPKEFRNSTVFNEDSYPFYKRRNTGVFEKSYYQTKIKIDNRFVVPYNPVLLMKFNSHINVEVCHSIQACKYLYKYIYKGFDRALIEVTDYDEIKNYVNSRYVSSVECYWRLRGYSMHGRRPAVIRLPIHLENEQMVVFDENEKIEKVVQEKHETHLTKWLDTNSKLYKAFDQVQKITYFEYPKYFTWNGRKWIKRKRNLNICKRDKKPIKKKIDENSSKMYKDIVVRTYNIPIQDKERNCLKSILKHHKGARSWKDLRTVIIDGKPVEFKNYNQAAIALGLLYNDQIWGDTLQEAINVNVNCFKLRKMFANMLIHCDIGDPERLWIKFKSELGDDFRRSNSSINEFDIDQMILIDIAKVLNLHEKQPEDFNLPKIKNSIQVNYEKLSSLTNQELQNFKSDCLMLSDEQKAIYKEIENALNERQNDTTKENLKNLFFIDAPGGYGKTSTLRTLANGMIMNGFTVISVAHSGVASNLLKNGRTAHSTFRIPIHLPEDEETYCSINKNSNLADFIRKIDLIIYDEATMSPKSMFECLDRTFRDICGDEFKNLKFANKIIVCAGDWRQTLPIILNGDKEDIVRNTLKNSIYWESMVKFKLTKNFRLGQKQKAFANYLLQVGQDKIPKVTESDQIELENGLFFENDDISNFLNWVYPKKNFNEENFEQNHQTALLTAFNQDVIKLNDILLNRFESNNPTREYIGYDKLQSDCDQMNIPQKILNDTVQSGMPLYKLSLKTGSPVMLLKNIRPEIGMCNGTKMIVREMMENLIRCQIISNDQFNLKIVDVFRICNTSDDLKAIKFKRIQFPITLSFALTINKAQGQSLTKIGIYNDKPLFSHGQLYVALSRGKKKENIKVFSTNRNDKKLINNIVFEEIVHDL